MQNEFLNELVESKSTVFCFLVNGIKLEGVIDGFDQFSVMLSANHGVGSTQLIMKSAISTIVPKMNAGAPKSF
ncbi:MAG: RNA chaperone Hfq [uncultured Thiotrichaceae bacterium]|uniref:RNA chaperone Hfq n=1 Tax=uncultured Thiotrichaceae bacterium TaxID=298394 RepID=A0A6S6U3I3_9GAMM|nr:MAG: RNA chaperone Hfq [uncultured Thiotrichaceae bacterium]